MASNPNSNPTSLNTNAEPLATDIIAPVQLELTPLPQPQITNPTPTVKTKTDDPYLVAFALPHDASNPKDWPSSRKWAVTDVLSATGFNRIMVSTIMAPALSTIAQDLDMNPAEAAMSLSIYLLATALGPLFIGPLSEVYGRSKVLHASNLWFLLWNIVCGFAQTKQVLIAARFLAGFGASAIYALAGGTLSDVWRSEQRGRSLGVYLMIPVLAVAVGPIIGGYMAGRTTWRWMFWATSIFQAVMNIVAYFTFRETYAPVILHRRAEELRKDTGDQRYYTEYERLMGNNQGLRSVTRIISRALSRPLRLLIFHPIIQLTALISGFQYGLLYIVLSSFADLWAKHYHVAIELSGLHYIAVALGEVAGTMIGGRIVDAYYRRVHSRRHEDELEPEHRIPLMIPPAVLAPLGLFIYGWTAHYRVHWITVDISIFIYAFGGQTAGMPLQAYVMDAYPDHTSSAMAANQFLRSLTAFLFPLFTPFMYEKMGYGWGNSMLAFVGLLLAIPAPGVIWWFGKSLRARATSSY